MRLAQRGAEIAGRGAGDGDGLALEQRQPLAPRHPVDGVLEDTGDTVVVFGRDQQQPVGPGQLRVQPGDGAGVPFAASSSPS